MMRCAHCRSEISREGNPFFPFCSERCRLIDLDKWLSGDYVVPGRDGEYQPADDQLLDRKDSEDAE
ncbi:MAG: DNA gyrase inhibitor YacG [Acidobacteria bacterium]|nr:DNA gyrase inhibitor YacG [Acidobacteriota bacterium]